MDNSQQTKVCDSLNGIIGAVSDKKVTVDSANAYENNGIKGIRFIAKIKEQDFPFFVGFLADSKYSEHLVFGVLKADVTDGINRLGNLDDDADGNKIQEKYRLNEKFFAKDAESQKSVLAKWINEQIQVFAILYRMKNGSPSKSRASEKSPARRKNLLSVLCLFFGVFGIHRFLTGKWKSGLLQMFSMGGFCIWWLLDTVRLFTGNYPDSDGILFKDKIAAYDAEHEAEIAQEIKQYEDIDTAEWFKIVELPWLIACLGIGTACFGPLFAETNEKMLMILGAVASFIFLAGIIAIIATIGAKNKIRAAKGLNRTRNPFSWFISHIGKAICGTTISVLGIGVFILAALFAAGVKSGSSSGGSSASRSSSGSSTSRTTSGPKMYWYICQRCGTSIRNPKNPSSIGCPNSTHHSWYKVGEVGDKNYCCKNCGITIQAAQNPVSIGCPNSTHHNWQKL